MRAVKEKAYAKINLFLDVVSKRTDGFHDIKTVMHSVSLSDDITVIYSKSSKTNVKMLLRGNDRLPIDEKNLAVKAVNLFLSRANATADITVILDKRIPISAGLAGGSSDAAAVLRAMNKLFFKLFTTKALVTMASELGSDVAYCLVGKTALCEGRGEIITKLDDTLKLNLVIAIANERVSTPMAYDWLDARYCDFTKKTLDESIKRYENLTASIKYGKLGENSIYNIFEDVVLEKCKGASNIKKRMTELGASFAMMSGSGPSVFGIFDSEESARRACEELRSDNVRAFLCESV